MNIIALVGLETIKHPVTHKVKFFADTFINNIRTWEKDKQLPIQIIDARIYRGLDNPMSKIWDDIVDYAEVNHGIDIMLYSGHSDWEGLYVISKYRKGEIPDTSRYIEYSTEDWSRVKFNPDADIYLMSCQAGGRFGKKWDWCIAQDIANKTGVNVWAFACRAGQRKRSDGGYEPAPDFNGYLKFQKCM